MYAFRDIIVISLLSVRPVRNKNTLYKIMTIFTTSFSFQVTKYRFVINTQGKELQHDTAVETCIDLLSAGFRLDCWHVNILEFLRLHTFNGDVDIVMYSLLLHCTIHYFIVSYVTVMR